MKLPAELPYVIHMHNAYRAGKHMDLRIQYPKKKKLISFAIPKASFPNRPGMKTMAIRVNDHSMTWLNKEKLNIPRGEYGGGHIQSLQKGNAYVTVWTSTYIEFQLEGKFASGQFYLFKTKRNKRTSRKGSISEIWILYKKMDRGNNQ